MRQYVHSLRRKLGRNVDGDLVALALAASLVGMALLTWAVIWQNGVISYQQNLIRALWNWRYSGG